MTDRKIGLKVTEEAVAMLCEAGYDPAFGARPVKRAVQHLLETSLAQAILRSDVQEEDTAVVSVAYDERFAAAGSSGGGGGGGGGASGMKLVVTREGDMLPPQPPIESFMSGAPAPPRQMTAAPPPPPASPAVPAYDPRAAAAAPPSYDPAAYNTNVDNIPAPAHTHAAYDPSGTYNPAAAAAAAAAAGAAAAAAAAVPRPTAPTTSYPPPIDPYTTPPLPTARPTWDASPDPANAAAFNDPSDPYSSPPPPPPAASTAYRSAYETPPSVSSDTF
jgi:hypothetical protein